MDLDDVRAAPAPRNRAGSLGPGPATRSPDGPTIADGHDDVESGQGELFAGAQPGAHPGAGRHPGRAVDPAEDPGDHDATAPAENERSARPLPGRRGAGLDAAGPGWGASAGGRADAMADRGDRSGGRRALGPGSEEGERAPRRRRRRVVVAGVAVLAGVVTAVVVGRRDGGGGEEGGGQIAAATTTAPVEVRDLVLSDEYEGELGFGASDAVTAGRSGVVTGVTPVGTTVGQGDVLFGLDLQPTVLLHGTIPAFRDLSVDADPGSDVTQLEQALVDLGFGDGLTVDGDFTAATAEAVEDWEEALGRSDPDGVVTLGDVVFAPADLRVAEVGADLGTQVQSGADVVTVTATTKVVTLQLTVDEVADIEAGTPVAVTLPDGTEVTGTIAGVADEPGSGGGTGEPGADPAEGDGGGDEETFPVTVALDDPAAAEVAAFESGTVDVTVERSRTEDATAVPVLALLALREGGYALQVVDDTQAAGYRLVSVEVGTIAGDWAQVTGDGIEAGIDVVVPE